MNYNYKLFDVNGLLVDGDDTPISKGNNAIDVFYFHFENHNYEDASVYVAVTLPDGTTTSGELPTAHADFTFKGTEYRGFKLTLLEPVTSQAGVITMTVHLVNRQDSTHLCTSRVFTTIYDSDVATDTTITDLQYDTLVQTIDDNFNELDNTKLYKDFSKYSNVLTTNATDTIVINRDGEVKKIILDDVYNIKTVNNIVPVNRNISLDSSKIPYDTGNVYDAMKSIENNLTEKATKIEVNTKVGHRTGTFESTDEYTVKTGILATTTDTIVDIYNFARILLADTEYIDGDILTCDVQIEFNKITGNAFSDVSFTRVLKVGTFTEYVLTDDGEGNFIKLELYGFVSNNILSLRIVDKTGYEAIKPSFKFAIVRRY